MRIPLCLRKLFMHVSYTSKLYILEYTDMAGLRVSWPFLPDPDPYEWTESRFCMAPTLHSQTCLNSYILYMNTVAWSRRIGFEPRLITPRWPTDIRLLLVQTVFTMVGQVRVRDTGKRGGKILYLCRQNL